VTDNQVQRRSASVAIHYFTTDTSTMNPTPPTHLLHDLLAGEAANLPPALSGLTVSDLTDDSRAVTPGALFICRDAAGDEAGQYLADAAERGAGVLVCGRSASRAWPDRNAGPPMVVIDAPVDQRFAGRVAERFFGEPTRRLQAIGITGTNGKTTVATLTQHLMLAANKHCGLIGTVTIDDGRSRRPAELTTPGSIELSRLLAQMAEHGCTHVVMEVSSHALHQGRVDHVPFAAGVFTNLTGDHLDYHQTMDHYAAAKAMLFEKLGRFGWAIVNADDPYAPRMLQGCQAYPLACRVRTPDQPLGAEDGFKGATACGAAVVELNAQSSRAVFDGPWGSVDATVPLVGKHNLANVLQAIAAAMCFVDLSKKLRRLLPELPGAPGRLEPVGPHWPDPEPESFDTTGLPTVLVDYAHTDDALHNVLSALRPVTRGRLVCVFGCGGDRDDTKRPRMAKAAYELADAVFVTSDNPRTEDPAAIIDGIVAGLPPKDERDKPVTINPDRAAAIERAIQSAEPGDTVLIAGKGHEDYQIIGKEKHHFDDREHAAAALRDRAGLLPTG